MRKKRNKSPKTKGLLLFVLLSLCASGAASETAPDPRPSRSPTLEIIAKPNGSYAPNKPILYQVRLTWEERASSLRLRPPVVDLENLEFQGVSAVAGSNPDEPTQRQEILSFKFLGRVPGSAQIRRLGLQWVGEGGSPGPVVEIPPSELMIKARPAPWLFLLPAVSTVVALSCLGILMIRRSKTTPSPAVEDHESLEAKMLQELQKLQGAWKNTTAAHVLTQLNRIAQAYLGQKLDWNRTQDGYNTLRKKAEHEWTRKEAEALLQFMESIEQKRFSGVALDERELIVLYETLVAFIERRKPV